MIVSGFFLDGFCEKVLFGRGEGFGLRSYSNAFVPVVIKSDETLFLVFDYLCLTSGLGILFGLIENSQPLSLVIGMHNISYFLPSFPVVTIR